MLIKGCETRGTFVSPDSQLSEQGKGQEGAPKNRAGAGGVGELVRGYEAGGEPTFRVACPGIGVCIGGEGLGWAVEPSFHSQSLKRFSARSRWPGWADPSSANIPAASPQ